MPPSLYLSGAPCLFLFCQWSHSSPSKHQGVPLTSRAHFVSCSCVTSATSCTRYLRVINLLWWLKISAGVEPDVLCFAAATRCCCRRLDWAAAISFLETTLREGFLPTSSTLEVRRASKQQARGKRFMIVV